MNGQIAFAAVTAALLTATAPSGASAADVSVSRRIIADAEDPMDAFGPLGAELDLGLVYVDWTIRGTGSDAPNVGISFDRADATMDLTCDDAGEQPNLGDTVIQIGAPYGNHHAIITVRPGDYTMFPANTFFCERRPESEDGFDARIRGLFFAQRMEIPTAELYSLRPVATGLEELKLLIDLGILQE